MAGNRWTAAEESALAELYGTRSNAEIADALNAEFGHGRNRNGVTQHAREMGLRKPAGYKKPHPKTMWPDEKRAWFREFVPGHTESEISAEHERLYGFPLTGPQIGNAKAVLGVKSGTVGGRFEKGREPFNKGKKWTEYGTPEGHERSRRTCYKPGNIPHNAIGKHVGYERISKDGYVEVKVKDGLQEEANSNYRMKHHVVYERHHGPIPPHSMIVFADHDKSNLDPSNLVAVPRSLWATISRKRIEYWDAESLEVAMNVAKVDRARSAAQRRPRPCKSCGREFEARYAHQRTCDKCLGRKVDR